MAGTPKVLLQRNAGDFQPRNVHQTSMTTKHVFSGNTYDLCDTSNCQSANPDFAPLPSPVGVGLDPASCFGQRNSRKRDRSRSFKCACGVGLVLEPQGGAWEEPGPMASAPSAWVPEQMQVAQATLSSLMPRPRKPDQSTQGCEHKCMVHITEFGVTHSTA